MICDFIEKDEGIVCKYCGWGLRHFKGKLSRTCTANYEYPSTAQMAKNLGAAMVNYALDRFRTVSTEERERRLSVCKSCNFYDEVQDRCKSCGCNSSLKTRIASSDCPIGLWGKSK